MESRKILPFKESIISFSPNIDHFLSVLENDHDVTFPWILENYIDLIIRKDEIAPPVFEFLDYNKIWWTCPFVHVSRIDREAFSVYGNLENAIKNLLEKNFYVFFLVDTYYVEGYVTYKKKHVMHDLLIYGYDEQYAYASDYFDFQYKKNKKILFSDLAEGYRYVPEGADYGRGVVLFKNKTLSDNIALYQYKESLGGKLDVEKFGYRMDRNLVKVKLGRFLESPDYVNSITPTLFDYRLGYTVGLKTLEILKDVIIRQEDVKVKDIHLLYCHVKMMLERVKYLMRYESDGQIDILKTKFENALEQVDILKKIIIKELFKETWNVEKISLRYKNFLDSYREVLREFWIYL